MSAQMTLPGFTSAISSPGSACGVSPCGEQDGRTTLKSGQDHAHASLSARQARTLGSLTSGTYGQRSITSYASAALQSSLESRLRARTQNLGSILYKMTWKRWATASGRSRSRLRASASQASATGYTGWATPTSRDHKDTGNLSKSCIRDGKFKADALPRQIWLHFTAAGDPSAALMESFASFHLTLARNLMGLPPEWERCAPTEMPSRPPLPRSS